MYLEFTIITKPKKNALFFLLANDEKLTILLHAKTRDVHETDCGEISSLTFKMFLRKKSEV